MPAIKIFFTVAALVWVMLALPVQADEHKEIWWEQAREAADRDGYRLITTAGLKDLYSRAAPMTVIDTRFSYEFEHSTLPGAIGVPFDLSDRFGLSAEKRQALLEAMGTDKERTTVFFCRDFR